MQVELDELEAKERAAIEHGPGTTAWSDYLIALRAAGFSLMAELRAARKTIVGTCHQVVSLSADKRKLEAEIRQLREALTRHAIHAEYDYPGDSPVFCGFTCSECIRTIEENGDGHDADCVLRDTAPAARLLQPTKETP